MSFCKGSHSVDGPDGCGNESCRGRELCVPTCATCPDFPNVHCQANHSVDDGCGNEDCRGQTYCVASCHDCPDFQPVIELARAGASLEQLFARARVPLSQVQGFAGHALLGGHMGSLSTSNAMKAASFQHSMSPSQTSQSEPSFCNGSHSVDG
eukprot:RCo011387